MLPVPQALDKVWLYYVHVEYRKSVAFNALFLFFIHTRSH